MEPDAIIVDEGQFMPEWFVKFSFFVAKKLSCLVVISGLDLDAWRRPFGTMPNLCAMADEVHKLEAVCNHCKSFEGRYTQKLAGSSDQIEVGDEIYEPRCDKCHAVPEIQMSQ
jgi:thymidine kinase